LNEAKKYTKKLTQFAPGQISSHLLAFQVAFRQNKFLMALQALNRALALNPENEQAKSFGLQFFKTVAPLLESMAEPVRLVLTSQEAKVMALIGAQHPKTV